MCGSNLLESKNGMEKAGNMECEFFYIEDVANKNSAADAVSERLIKTNVNVGKYKIRFTSAYMPHGAYPDSEVEGVYVEIENLIKTGRE